MDELRFFAVLDCDNLVINCTTFPVFPVNPEELPESIIENNYSNRYRLVEYSESPGITNNPASIGHTYDEQLNAFIPRCPGEGYVLDPLNYVWVSPDELPVDPNDPVIPI